VESRPDLVTGTVFKTVVGASNAPGRVRFPCGSAILISLLLTHAAHAAPDVAHPPAALLVAREIAEAACLDQAYDLRALLAAAGIHDAQVGVCTGTGRTFEEAKASSALCVKHRVAALRPDRHWEEASVVGPRTCYAQLMMRKLAQVATIPTTARPFEELRISAVMESSVAFAELLLMDPRGHVEPLAVSSQGRQYGATATLHGGNGTYTVQLMVDAGHGPEVAAEARVVVGKPQEPAPITIHARAADADAVGEALRLFRARENLPTLTRDGHLAAAAARRMDALVRGPLLHVDAAGSGMVEAYMAQPEARPVSRIAEVLSAGPNAMDAFNALLKSPAHGRHLQDPTFTHQGVALARSPSSGDWILVVALSRPVDAADETLRLAVLERLNSERARRGLKLLTAEPLLLPLAQQHARRCADLQGLSDAVDDGRRLSDVALGRVKASRAGVQLYRVSRASEVTPSPTILDARYGRAGIGLHTGSGVDGLYVVVILVEP